MAVSMALLHWRHDQKRMRGPERLAEYAFHKLGIQLKNDSWKGDGKFPSISGCLFYSRRGVF
jgi:hypothetical protein